MVAVDVTAGWQSIQLPALDTCASILQQLDRQFPAGREVLVPDSGLLLGKAYSAECSQPRAAADGVSREVALLECEEVGE